MCNFHSSISDGKGNVKFFTPEDIVKIMSEGNPKNYDFNSHTSVCHFFGITGREEDKWNKWEYDPKTKKLSRDLMNTEDDSKKVQKVLDKFFKDKDLGYLINLYGTNSGNRNSGNWNSGNWNSGDWNSGDGVLNSFCSEKSYMLFNKPCTREEYEETYNLSYSWFDLTQWITGGDMTAKEKEEHPYWEITGGYLKTIDYKEAWKKCPKGFIEKVKKLKNFDAKVFEEISGITI